MLGLPRGLYDSSGEASGVIRLSSQLDCSLPLSLNFWWDVTGGGIAFWAPPLVVCMYVYDMRLDTGSEYNLPNQRSVFCSTVIVYNPARVVCFSDTFMWPQTLCRRVRHYIYIYIRATIRSCNHQILYECRMTPWYDHRTDLVCSADSTMTFMLVDLFSMFLFICIDCTD